MLKAQFLVKISFMNSDRSLDTKWLSLRKYGSSNLNRKLQILSSDHSRVGQDVKNLKERERD